MALGKVKVAVAMNQYGQWAAYGEYDMSDNQMLEEANGHVPQTPAVTLYWVEAEVPLPVPESYPGKVIPAGKEPEIANSKIPSGPDTK